MWKSPSSSSPWVLSFHEPEISEKIGTALCWVHEGHVVWLCCSLCSAGTLDMFSPALLLPSLCDAWPPLIPPGKEAESQRS